MACQPEPVRLPASCRYCGTPVDVTYAPATNRDTLVNQEYRCPFCEALNALKIPGRVINVTDRPSK